MRFIDAELNPHRTLFVYNPTLHVDIFLTVVKPETIINDCLRCWRSDFL